MTQEAAVKFILNTNFFYCIDQKDTQTPNTFYKRYISAELRK